LQCRKYFAHKNNDSGKQDGCIDLQIKPIEPSRNLRPFLFDFKGRADSLIMLNISPARKKNL
jgi:hypothetical protein